MLKCTALVALLALGTPGFAKPAGSSWNKDSVRAGLSALGRAGYTLSSAELKHLSDPRAKRILSDAVGFEARPRVLLEQTTALFGSLQNALWTEHTVKRALQALHRGGHRPNASFFKYTKSTPAIQKLLQDAVGFPVDLYTVFTQSKRFYGDFKTAMERSGLPVDKLYHVRESQPWTKELVSRCLRALFAAGYKPKLYFLQTSKDERAREIVNATTGFDTTLNTLLNKAKDLNAGDFNHALQQSGLHVDEVQTVNPRTPWTKELVHASLNALFAAGFVPSASFLQRNEDAEAIRLLIETVGFETNLNALYLKAVHFHGDQFQSALSEAGLPVERIVGKFSNRKWTKEAVHGALRALFENGFPVYASSLQGDNPDAERIIADAMGFPASLTGLYAQARAFHEGRYQLALTEAGLPAEDLVDRLETKDLTPENIATGLRALFARRLFPSANLMSSKSREAVRVLKEALGFPVTLRSFYHYARQYHGGRMVNALRAADLPLEEFASYWTKDRIVTALRAVEMVQEQEPVAASPGAQLTQEQVIEHLRALYNQGVMYNAPAATRGSRKLTAFVSNLVGFKTSARFLYDQATLLFGNYRRALIAADLPADDIILYRNRCVDLLAGASTQVERIEENGSVRYQTFLGDTPANPEEELLSGETERVWIESLPPDLRVTGQAVLETIFSLEGDSLQSGAIFSQLAQKGISLPKAQKVFQLFKNNPMLYEQLVP